MMDGYQCRASIYPAHLMRRIQDIPVASHWFMFPGTPFVNYHVFLVSLVLAISTGKLVFGYWLSFQALKSHILASNVRSIHHVCADRYPLLVLEHNLQSKAVAILLSASDNNWPKPGSSDVFSSNGNEATYLRITIFDKSGVN